MEKKDELTQEQIKTEQDTLEQEPLEEKGMEILEHRKLEDESEFYNTALEEPLKKSSDELIDEARDMVHQSDSVVRDCMSILDDDIATYEQKKAKLLQGSVKRVESLLDDVGYEPEAIEDVSEDAVKFGGENALKPMYVKSLSSAKFSSLLFAIIFAVASVAGWVYFATEKLGLTLDLHKIPTPEVQSQILSWIGGSITGGQGNPLIGMAILGLTALLVMWIVYTLRVSMRASKNQKIAEQVHEEAEFYCTKKEECKKEMEKVSEHILKVVTLLDTYDILFEEQIAKIKRIMHVEGRLPFHEYHQNSKDEMNHAGRLATSLSNLISTPMADEGGALSMDAKDILEESNKTVTTYIERFYN